MRFRSWGCPWQKSNIILERYWVAKKSSFSDFCCPASFYIFFHDVRDNSEITVFGCLIDISAWKHPPDAPGTSRGVPGHTIDCSDPCKILIGATTFLLSEMSSIISFKFRGQNKTEILFLWTRMSKIEVRNRKSVLFNSSKYIFVLESSLRNFIRAHS